MSRFLLALLLVAICAAPAAARDTAVLVHGLNPDPRDLDPMERYLQMAGFAVERFEYDDRQDLDQSAVEFGEFLRSGAAARADRLVVIAHSMGGLVSRRAFTVGHSAGLAGLDRDVELVTIASPLGGLAIADLARADLGLGPDSFDDCGRTSDFVQRPGRLPASVRHVRVETVERGTVRTRDGLLRSDSVVPLRAQRNPDVDAQATVLRVAAGHVGVLNDGGRLSPTLRVVLDGLVARPRLLADASGR